jgi:hypothetical protein
LRLAPFFLLAQGNARAGIEGDAHTRPVVRISFLGCPDCEE